MSKTSKNRRKLTRAEARAVDRWHGRNKYGTTQTPDDEVKPAPATSLWGHASFMAAVVLVTFVLMAGIFSITKACAQPPQEDAVQLRYQGTDGVWFPGPFARELLELYSVAPSMEQRIAVLRQAGTEATEEIRNLRLALEVGDAAEQDLGRQLRDSQRAREELESWYREPGLWLGLGVAAGALVVGLLWMLVAL